MWWCARGWAGSPARWAGVLSLIPHRVTRPRPDGRGGGCGWVERNRCSTGPDVLGMLLGPEKTSAGCRVFLVPLLVVVPNVSVFGVVVRVRRGVVVC